MRVRDVLKDPTIPKAAITQAATPKTFKGRQVYHFTHFRAIYSLFGCGARQRVKQYNQECVETLKRIPVNYSVFSASQYGELYGVSHVTAKKRLKRQITEPNSMILQISPKYFLKAYDEQSFKFAVYVIARYHSVKLPKYKVHLPNIFTALQKIQQSESAFYSVLKKLVGQPVLTVLQHMQVLHKIQPDFMRSRASLVYAGGW